MNILANKTSVSSVSRITLFTFLVYQFLIAFVLTDVTQAQTLGTDQSLVSSSEVPLEREKGEQTYSAGNNDDTVIDCTPCSEISSVFCEGEDGNGFRCEIWVHITDPVLLDLGVPPWTITELYWSSGDHTGL